MSTKKFDKVREVMKLKVEFIDGLATVAEAIKKMRENGFGSLIVAKRDESDEYGFVNVQAIAMVAQAARTRAALNTKADANGRSLQDRRAILDGAKRNTDFGHRSWRWRQWYDDSMVHLLCKAIVDLRRLPGGAEIYEEQRAGGWDRAGGARGGGSQCRA